MKWKIKPCFFFKYDPDSLVVFSARCVEQEEFLECEYSVEKGHTWETCPHGKSQLVEEDDG